MTKEKKVRELTKLVGKILRSGYSKKYIDKNKIQEWVRYIFNGGPQPSLPNNSIIGSIRIMEEDPYIIYWENLIACEQYVRLKELYDFIDKRRTNILLSLSYKS